MLELDRWLTRLINSPAGLQPALDGLMIAATHAGVPLLVLAVGLRWWSRANRPFERQVAIETALAFVLGLLVNQIVILLVARVRPYEAGLTHLIVAPSADPSFPSDHATAAAAIVAALWLNGLRRRALAFAVPALLILVSRVYIGTHYASDVLGGSGTGLVAALAAHGTAARRAPLDAVLARIL